MLSLILVIVFILLSMIASCANSAPSVPMSLMSLEDHVNLGLISKLDPNENKVIGITTTFGSNDDECLADVIKKAITKVPYNYVIVGIYSAFVNGFAHTDSDGNRFVRSNNIFICGGEALLKKINNDFLHNLA